MATNKIIDRHRTELSQRKIHRERSKAKELADCGDELDRSDFPDDVIECRELLASIKERLSTDEMEISRLRSEGKSWLQVSQTLGESPHALRKRLERACDQIFKDLGIRVP